MFGLIITSMLLIIPDSWFVGVFGCKIPGLWKLGIFIIFIISIASIINDLISCDNKKQKKDNVVKWRNMVNEVIKKQDKNENNIKAAVYLERHKDYYSLRPHLSKATFVQLCRAREFTLGSTISPPLKFILDDIDRLEKKWGLI